MNAEYVKKLALPEEVKEIYPVTAEMNKAVETTKQEVAKVIEGFSDKLVLIIGDPRCVRYMIDNNCSDERCTGLRQRLSSQSSYTVFDM